MQTARRLYIYLLSGISLGALVAGLSMLLTVLFGRLGLGATGEMLFGGEESIRQQLTLASALTAVSLPVWLIHWFAAERSVRVDRPNAAIERTSGVRGLYFALAMGGLLLATALGLDSALEGAILRRVGDAEFGYRDIGGGLALGLAAGAAMAYHVRIRTRDWARGEMSGAGAWLPRTYLYVATFAGLMVLLLGIQGLIELVGRLLLDEPTALVDAGSAPWWAYPLASAITSVAIGGAIWLGHASYADRLRRDPGHRGASERPARLRLAYFVVAIAATATATIYQVAEGAGNALAAALGVAEAVGSEGTIGLIVLPLLIAIPFAVAWWLHGHWMEAESMALESRERVETAYRLEIYPVAVIGLAFGAIATAWLIGLVIEVVLGGGTVLVGGDTWRREAAQFVPLALAGWGVWIWRWRDVGARWAVDPMGEASSTIRRAALLVVLAGSVLAGIASLGVILYRLFGSLFGVALSTDPVSELSGPIGGLVIAAAVAAYHLAALRRDQALRAGIDTSPSEPAAAAPTTALRLSGPPASDLAGVVAVLRQHLPPGYALDVADEPQP